MRLVYLFSLCLIAGMICSQFFDLLHFRSSISLVSDIALAYILMTVGLEFVIDKKQGKGYLYDYWVAVTAAGLPWMLCFVYLLMRTDQAWPEILLLSLFAAPTSSGILFSMLASAGLGTSWLFHKVRTLTILDDVNTILFMIPLQLLLMKIGKLYQPIFGIFFAMILVVVAWRYLHRLKLPSGRVWLLVYAIALTALLRVIDVGFYLEIDILLPAFIWGALLYHDPERHPHEQAYLEPETKALFLDRGIKIAFVFIVGLFMPKIEIEKVGIFTLVVDVLLLSLLLILGKCVPLFCYRKEATLRERIAVAISMCVRGEVGKAVFILAIAKGAGGYAATVAGLALTLNLLLTGVFVTIAITLLNFRPKNCT